MLETYDILLGRQPDGNYIRLGGSDPVALYARTRSGKTADFVIPNAFAYPGSLVILDIKGEAWKATAGHRARRGQDVFLFNPLARDGETDRWNPLGVVDRTSIDRFDQIARQAFLLFPEATTAQSGNGNAEFWTSAARDAFIAVTTLIAETPSEPLTLANVLRVFSRGDGPEWLDQMIQDRRTAGGRQYSRLAVDGVSDYLTGASTQVHGIRKSVSTRLAPWRNPRTAATTEVSDFDLTSLRRKPTSIYVAVAPGNIPRLRPLLRLFFDQLISVNTEDMPEDDPTLTTQCLLLLDEFVRLGVVETLSDAIQYVAGYGFRMAIVVQNKASIEAVYGKPRLVDIFQNMGAEILFGSTDTTLAKEIEERLGDNTVASISKNRPRFLAGLNPSKQSESEHLHRRPLMLDQEFMKLPPDEQIILRPGMDPARTKRMRWFLLPEFTKLECTPPILKTLSLSVDDDDGTSRVVNISTLD